MPGSENSHAVGDCKSRACQDPASSFPSARFAPAPLHSQLMVYEPAVYGRSNRLRGGATGPLTAAKARLLWAASLVCAIMSLGLPGQRQIL